MTRMNQTSTGDVLITGVAGFVGSHLAERLLSLGHRVIGVDSLIRGTLRNLETARANPNFEFIQLDLCDPKSAVPTLAARLKKNKILTVWHMAANSDIEAGVEDPDVDLKHTFLTTYTVLGLMRVMGVAELRFASSSAIYGEHRGPLTECTGPLTPASNYGAMKLASEGSICSATETYLKRAQIYRFPNVVGNHATHGVIFDFIQKLKRDPGKLPVLGDGTQQKPYLHVSELVDAMLVAESQDTSKIGLFNIRRRGRIFDDGAIHRREHGTLRITHC